MAKSIELTLKAQRRYSNFHIDSLSFRRI